MKDKIIYFVFGMVVSGILTATFVTARYVDVFKTLNTQLRFISQLKKEELDYFTKDTAGKRIKTNFKYAMGQARNNLDERTYQLLVNQVLTIGDLMNFIYDKEIYNRYQLILVGKTRQLSIYLKNNEESEFEKIAIKLCKSLSIPAKSCQIEEIDNLVNAFESNDSEFVRDFFDSEEVQVE